MTSLSIHEEASKAYREALADGCACWRCQDAGLRAVLSRVGERVQQEIEAAGLSGVSLESGSRLARLVYEMRWPPSVK